MVMLAAAAIGAGMWPPRNRRAVNKQRYHCTSTEDLRLCPRQQAESSSPAGDRVPQWRRQGCTVHDRPGTIFSNSSAELIFGLD